MDLDSGVIWDVIFVDMDSGMILVGRDWGMLDNPIMDWGVIWIS